MDVTIYANISDTIKRLAEQYRMIKHGRGTTHESAYIQGAKDALRLIKEGKYNINSITL